jgi:hypothetical protein
MIQFRNVVWVLFLGSLWGLSEVIGGKALYGSDVPRASLWLTSWALFVLALGRGLFDKPGSSTAIAAIAALYRTTNASPFFCHVCGILFLGIAFDAAAALFSRLTAGKPWRWGLTGIGSAYGGNALFALIMTYVIRYRYWADAGLPKVLDHIFVGGSLAALAAVLLVPFARAVGARGKPVLLRRAGWSLTGALFLSLVIWIVGGLGR